MGGAACNLILLSSGRYTLKYKFRSNSDLCLTGYHRQILPGVFAYGIQFDLNLYHSTPQPAWGV